MFDCANDIQLKFTLTLFHHKKISGVETFISAVISQVICNHPYAAGALKWSRTRKPHEFQPYILV